MLERFWDTDLGHNSSTISIYTADKKNEGLVYIENDAKGLKVFVGKTKISI